MEKVKRKQEGSSEADVGNRKQKKEGRDRRVQRAPPADPGPLDRRRWSPALALKETRPPGSVTLETRSLDSADVTGRNHCHRGEKCSGG